MAAEIDTFLSSFSTEPEKSTHSSKYIIYYGKDKSGLIQPAIHLGRKSALGGCMEYKERQSRVGVLLKVIYIYIYFKLLICWIYSITSFLTQVCRSVKTAFARK